MKPSAHDIPQRVIDTIMDRVEVRGADKCWPWKLSTASHGYGQIGWRTGKHNAGTTAHRVVWIHHFGPIPEAMTVDHKCRNRVCCNPRHLRLKTNVDNGTENGWKVRTHCSRGHEYNDMNTRVNKLGHRQCRVCDRIRWAQRAA